MSASNLQLIQNVYAAFGRGDVPAILEVCAEDVEFGVISESVLPWHGIGRGRAHVVKFFQALGETTDFTRFEPHSFIADDNGVACLVDWDATLKKNGHKVTARVVHHFTISKGRITRWNGSEDTAKAEKAWNG